MKWLWRLGGLLVAFGLIVYFLWFTWQNLDLHAFAAALKKPWTIVALLLAIACHIAVYPLTGVAWRHLLLRQGESWRPGELTRLISLTQLRSEEHTSELQSLMRISYAVFCLKKKK